MPASPANALKERCRGISAGLFAAPLGTLAEATRSLADWGGQILHFDVMDGVFVPGFTGGPAFVAALGDGLVRDVHLMVAQPEEHVAAFAKAGADIITVHAEAPTAREALAAVRAAATAEARPILAGLAVMPDTPLPSLVPLLDPLPDLILVLALDPRDGKPADLDKAAERMAALAQMLAPARPIMAIDGGVTEKTIATAAAAAPDMIVSGSAIFRAPDPGAAFARLAAAARPQALEKEQSR